MIWMKKTKMMEKGGNDGNNGNTGADGKKEECKQQ